jgi:hypothetical protein
MRTEELFLEGLWRVRTSSSALPVDGAVPLKTAAREGFAELGESMSIAVKCDAV